MDKTCFQHDAAYNKYKDLKNITQSDIVLKNRAYEIAHFFNERSKKELGSGIENKQLADELHKQIIKKFKRRKVYSSYKDNIWMLI